MASKPYISLETYVLNVWHSKGGAQGRLEIDYLHFDCTFFRAFWGGVCVWIGEAVGLVTRPLRLLLLPPSSASVEQICGQKNVAQFH